MEGHAEATRGRSQDVGSILAVHDTTTCAFGGAGIREGTFAISSKKSGFLAHICLAVAADGSRQPLGVLGMTPVVRLEGEAAEASPGTVYSVESQRSHDLVAVVQDEAAMTLPRFGGPPAKHKQEAAWPSRRDVSTPPSSAQGRWLWSSRKA